MMVPDHIDLYCYEILEEENEPSISVQGDNDELMEGMSRLRDISQDC